MNENKITNEYIQFSKKVTRWGIILVSCALIICLGIIAIFSVEPEIAATVSHLYSAYITIMGITIGAYQGNSSLEKWTKARYKFSESLKEEGEENQEEEEESDTLG